MSHPLVRHLTAADLPLIAWSGSPTHLEYIEGALDRAKNGEVDFLCVSVGEEIVGLGAVDYTAHPGFGKLWMINVHEAHQSRGYGSILIEELEHSAAERGIDAVQLSVESFNERARKLYQRLGYIDVGKSTETWNEESPTGEISKYHANCLIMQKSLL